MSVAPALAQFKPRTEEQYNQLVDPQAVTGASTALRQRLAHECQLEMSKLAEERRQFDAILNQAREITARSDLERAATVCGEIARGNRYPQMARIAHDQCVRGVAEHVARQKMETALHSILEAAKAAKQKNVTTSDFAANCRRFDESTFPDANPAARHHFQQRCFLDLDAIARSSAPPARPAT